MLLFSQKGVYEWHGKNETRSHIKSAIPSAKKNLPISFSKRKALASKNQPKKHLFPLFVRDNLLDSEDFNHREPIATLLCSQFGPIVRWQSISLIALWNIRVSTQFSQ